MSPLHEDIIQQGTLGFGNLSEIGEAPRQFRDRSGAAIAFASRSTPSASARGRPPTIAGSELKSPVRITGRPSAQGFDAFHQQARRPRRRATCPTWSRWVSMKKQFPAVPVAQHGPCGRVARRRRPIPANRALSGVLAQPEHPRIKQRRSGRCRKNTALYSPDPRAVLPADADRPGTRAAGRCRVVELVGKHLLRPQHDRPPPSGSPRRSVRGGNASCSCPSSGLS